MAPPETARRQGLVSELVSAAGGVVLRRGAGGDEVLLVHRPRYDDWSLPKGKLLAGESEAAAALREVEEETGFVCRLGPEVGTSSYRDGQGRPKTVRYWLMEPVAGAFTPHSEVDEVRWLPFADAPTLLSYDRDRAVLASVPR
jgi:8-oxo-dGTP pyrophosphatase MutT (NUDIX family)